MKERKISVSTKLLICGELKKDETIFRIHVSFRWNVTRYGIKLNRLPPASEKFLDYCQITDLLDREIFESEWDFYDLREAINFQRGLCTKLGLPDPLDIVKN